MIIRSETTGCIILIIISKWQSISYSTYHISQFPAKYYSCTSLGCPVLNLTCTVYQMVKHAFSIAKSKKKLCFEKILFLFSFHYYYMYRLSLRLINWGCKNSIFVYLYLCYDMNSTVSKLIVKRSRYYCHWKYILGQTSFWH